MFSLKSVVRVVFARPVAPAVAAVLLSAGSAPAQYIAPDVHGYAAQQLRQRYSSGSGTTRFQAPAVRYAPSAGTAYYYSAVPAYQPAVVAPAAPAVVYSTPAPAAVATSPVPQAPAVAAAPAPAFVGIQGPDGVVRYYSVEGGADALRSVIVVAPGQPATARVVAPPAR